MSQHKKEMAALDFEEAELVKRMGSLGMTLVSEDPTDAPPQTTGTKPKQRSSGEGNKDRAIPTLSYGMYFP